MRAALLSAAAAAAAVAVAVSNAGADAGASAVIEVHADLSPSAPATPLSFPVLNCAGSGHAALTLRSDWRAHWSAVRNDIGFKRVRFHGIFDDDMSTYLPGYGSKAGANMANVFNSLDNIFESGAEPIVELSFMPAALASAPNETVFHYMGGTSAPQNMTTFAAFVGEFVGLILERYGLETTSKLLLEVWNEPNCGFYTSYTCCGPACGNQTAYFELYAAMHGAIKAVHPSLRVGGPATAQLGWIAPFLEWTTAHGVKPDFVSSHLYPTDPGVPATRDGFAESIADAAAVVAAAGLPFVVTEFNSGLGINVADEPYSAAFVVHNHLALQGVPNLETLSYWTFTDVFEEQGFDPLPFDQKFGMMTIQGVPKPVYRGFQFIAQLPSAAVPVKASGATPVVPRAGSVSVGTVDAVVGTSPVTLADAATGAPVNKTRAVALLTNFNVYGAPIAMQQVTLTFANLPATAEVPAHAAVSLIDAAHAYAPAVWRASGSPVYPSPRQVAAQMAASRVYPAAAPLTPLGDGSYAVSLTLLANATALVTFEY